MAKVRKKYKTAKRDLYEEITNKILKQLDEGIVPWKKPWVGGGPSNYYSGKQYRGVNVLVLAIDQWAGGHTSNKWLTYRQAKTLKGYVKKGQRGSTIVFWKFIDKEKEVEVDGETELIIDRIPLMRSYTVFNVEQCEGLPAEDKMPEIRLLQSAENIKEAYSDCPPIQYGAGRAFYSITKDMIGMPAAESFDSVEEHYSTLFHEMIHSTGHKAKLNRFSGEVIAMGAGSYSKEELVAELGAAFLCATADQDISEKTIENSAAYIDGWRRKISQDKRLVVTAAGAAQRATDYILKGRPEPRPSKRELNDQLDSGQISISKYEELELFAVKEGISRADIEALAQTLSSQANEELKESSAIMRKVLGAGGISPHKGGFMAEEYKDIPNKHKRRDGQAIDEICLDLGMSESELIGLIRRDLELRQKLPADRRYFCISDFVSEAKGRLIEEARNG